MGSVLGIIRTSFERPRVERYRTSRCSRCAVWFVSARGTEGGVGQGPFLAPRMDRGHGDLDAADGDTDQRAPILRSFRADGAAGGRRRAWSPSGRGGARLRAAHRPSKRTTGGVDWRASRRPEVRSAEEVELAFLDAVSPAQSLSRSSLSSMEFLLSFVVDHHPTELLVLLLQLGIVGIVFDEHVDHIRRGCRRGVRTDRL